MLQVKQAFTAAGLLEVTKREVGRGVVKQEECQKIPAGIECACQQWLVQWKLVPVTYRCCRTLPQENCRPVCCGDCVCVCFLQNLPDIQANMEVLRDNTVSNVLVFLERELQGEFRDLLNKQLDELDKLQ